MELEKLVLDNGYIACALLPFGATLQSLWVPDRTGVRRDVVLGYDSLSEYERNDGYLGATVGRYANRIHGARFALDGREYALCPNEGPNQLHGGGVGFSHRIWTVEEASRERAVFSLHSADGEEGYPGALQVRVSYTLEGAALRIAYEALSDRDTVCNLTNHSYFNLAGHDSGSIAAQELWIEADAYTPVDAALIPTGEIAAVAGTKLDFRTLRPIGGGYDHNFVLSGGAVALSRESGIRMELGTTMPGLQLYTSGALTERRGKGGCLYAPGHGFCLETQFFPDSPNQPHFPSPLLRAGERYKQETVYSFSQA